MVITLYTKVHSLSCLFSTFLYVEYVLFKARVGVALSNIKRKAEAERFISDKARLQVL